MWNGIYSAACGCAILFSDSIFLAETNIMPSEKSDSRSRKEAILASLYDEYYDKIARYIYSKTGNSTEAQELTGEVFLKALESLDAYEERGIPMHAWLFKIAHNLLVDHLRRLSKYKTSPIDTVELTSDSDPVATAEVNLQLAALASALNRLTPAQRRVIELRFFSGLTSQETGTILNKSSGAVREMQRAAIIQLRKLLTGQG